MKNCPLKLLWATLFMREYFIAAMLIPKLKAVLCMGLTGLVGF